MQIKNKSWHGGSLFGIALGISLAVASLATFSRPADADDKRGNGMDCKRDVECRSNDCFHDHCRGKNNERNDDGGFCAHNEECKSNDCFKDHCRGKEH